MNDRACEPEWGRPNRRDYWWRGCKGNVSCLDCEHLQVAGQPLRRCDVYRAQHIWMMDAEAEIAESGFSVATGCRRFALCVEAVELFAGLLVVWAEETGDGKRFCE